MAISDGARRVRHGRITTVGRRCAIGASILALSACASVRGHPEAITAADVKERVCPSDDQMDRFSSLTGDTRGAYRDRVISICIGAYNRRFADFTASLSDESVSANLLADLLSSSLTTAAGIASPKAAKRLTAGAGLALGFGSAVNKNVFYSATLPALLTSMDARKSEILIAIVNAEKADPQGLNYSLARAGLDLDRYENAGSLIVGLNDLNQAASTAAAKAASNLATAQRTAGVTFTAVVLDKNVSDRVAALATKVKNLGDNPTDRATLDALAVKLGMTPQPTDKTDLKIGYVITAMLDVVNTADPADQQKRIAGLEDDLNPIFP
jgi:hypothetical protein